jgi:hypothetical protein
MSKDPFQCVRQKVPVRTSWTHGYLDLSGPTVQSRPNQAPSAGCPGWCNLPTATLVAHFASWSRTLAALRPKALPFPVPFPAPCRFFRFALGASLLCGFVRSVLSSQSFLFLSASLSTSHSGDLPSTTSSHTGPTPRLADRPSHSCVAVPSDLWRPGRRTLAEGRLQSPVPMPALS